MKEKIVSRETLLHTRELYQENYDKFEDYLNQLLWWNEKVNLVSREVSRETVREHIVHSLLPFGLTLLDGCTEWVDAGTGGGLPGLPLSMTDSKKKWILNDLVSKKIAALKQMIYNLQLPNVKATADSVENLLLPENCGVITKHAFKYEDLLKMIMGKSWKKLIMFKGFEEAKEEIQQVKSEGSCVLYRFDFGEDEPFYTGKGILVIEG